MQQWHLVLQCQVEAGHHGDSRSRVATACRAAFRFCQKSKHPFSALIPERRFCINRYWKAWGSLDCSFPNDTCPFDFKMVIGTQGGQLNLIAVFSGKNTVDLSCPFKIGSLLKMLCFPLIRLSQCNIFRDAQKVFMSLTPTDILKS